MTLLEWCGIAALVAVVGTIACTRRKETSPQGEAASAASSDLVGELRKTTFSVATDLRGAPPDGAKRKPSEAARAVEIYNQMNAIARQKAGDAGASSTNEGDRATQMRVELAIVEDGKRVFEDTLTFTTSEQEQSYRAKTGDTSRSYVVKYSFGPPASLEITGPAYRAGFAIGIHRSSEWESSVIGNNWATLLLKCTPLP